MIVGLVGILPLTPKQSFHFQTLKSSLDDDQPVVIYDGAIIVKEKPSFIRNVSSKGFVAGVQDYWFPQGTSAVDERVFGYEKMLRIWSREVESGLSLEQLSVVMDDILSRQSSAHTDFRYHSPASIPFVLIQVNNSHFKLG